MWEPGETSDEELITDLAGLSKLAYGKRRRDAAKKIGIGVGKLDEIVIEARGAGKGEGEEGADVLYEHWNVQPWPEPVDGGILLRAIKETIQRYVFMSQHQAVAVTLWTVFSWLHEHMTHTC